MTYFNTDFSNFDLGLDASTPVEDQLGPTFILYQMSDMKERKLPQWLIRDLIFQRQIGVVYAPPGSFKSFVTLDLCSRLVHGLEWKNRALKPHKVIYVAGEGFSMFYHRRLAWFKHHGLPPCDDGLGVVDRPVNLTDADSVNQFLADMRGHSDGVGLIVFDTLSTCTAGQNESDSGVMTSAIENAKIIGRELDTAVLFVHHPGKDLGRGARGHSSLLGNIDTEWLITRNDKNMACTLRVTKQKDAEDGQLFHFTAYKIPLGILDDDGEELSSLAVIPGEPTNNIPGETLSREEADRISIANAMEAGIDMSLTQLSKRLTKSMQCGKRSAIDRIQRAIPTVWTRARKSANEVLELRRVVHSFQNLHVIEARSVNDDTDILD